jgi:hypothetical protein
VAGSLERRSSLSVTQMMPLSDEIPALGPGRGLTVVKLPWGLVLVRVGSRLQTR